MRVMSMAIVLSGQPDWVVACLKETQTFYAVFCGDEAIKTAERAAEQMPDLMTYIETGLVENSERVASAALHIGKYQVEADRLVIVCEATQALEVALLVRHFRPLLCLRSDAKITIFARSEESDKLQDDFWAMLKTWHRIKRAERL